MEKPVDILNEAISSSQLFTSNLSLQPLQDPVCWSHVKLRQLTGQLRWQNSPKYVSWHWIHTPVIESQDRHFFGHFAQLGP